jgi:hypothetical protein
VSALLIAALILAAGLLAIGIATAFCAYEAAADRVTEGTRMRIYAANYTGRSESGHVAEEGRRDALKPKP